ncbi:hypothetical protein DPEC_G00290010 [Dallia pectoralis]|uniref:Uncharacterized protein n=1 Tax=Dallia pectoralis TaxID=75939 RepID=A0ACC2FHC1_DALPE|nr:hypothetical protein DPEC_G00290010 [Dallia pectoralis]
MTNARQFVSDRLEISTYLLEVEAAKYRDICSQYKYMRKIRGDGNCFYRALCFGHLESLLQNDRCLTRFKDTVIQSGRELLAAGFEESSFKHLLDMFVGVVEQCEADGQGDSLLQLFNEKTTSDSLVQYLRLLTSAYLQNHADFFSHFVEAPSLKVYCTQEVETMSMECDHVDILALSEALGVSVHIASVEGGAGQHLAHHIIPEGAETSLHLLYKTAHYDILYPQHCR